MGTLPPIVTAPLFAPLHEELMALLRGLEDEEWNAPTVAGSWTVKDVTSHLLDTAIRRLSVQRDRQARPPADPSAPPLSLGALVGGLNQQWVEATRRLSPRILVQLLDLYGRELTSYLESLDPLAPAAWSVSWAGEETSAQWFDTARELTERWHHQQQIRDATGRPPLYDRQFFDPVIDAFVRALPYTYRDVEAPDGTVVALQIAEPVSRTWSLTRGQGAWTLSEGSEGAATSITMTADTAWRLFTNGLTPEAAAARVEIEGDPRYGQAVLSMLCIVA
ncbi:MAG: hypothetical protein JWN02_2649 [Acidobacteria bacterium]|nr:hypothetical protein [Acidobacteriota bacterium]